MFVWVVSFLFLLSHSADLSTDKAGRHAVYVSVVEINYTSGAKKGTMMVKVFTDDLEDAILNQTGNRVKLTRKCDQNLVVLTDYLKEHLKLSINNQPVEYNIAGCENVDISTWLEFVFTCDNEWQTVEISDDHLMELFPTQSNVFSVKYNEQKRMFRLTSAKKSAAVFFD